MNSRDRNLWDTKLFNGHFFSGLFGVVSTSSLVHILSLIDFPLPRRRGQFLCPVKQSLYELLSWSSDSVVIDKCQQVSYKPSSLLFGMLNTKEGKNSLAVNFCSSERGLLWLGSQLVLFHPGFALRSRFSSYRKTFAAKARLGNPWQLYQPVHIKRNSPCTAILRSSTKSLRFTLCCKSVP